MDNDVARALTAAIQGLADANAARAGGSKKVRTLSTRSARDWRNWRQHFEDVARINGWNNQRQRREARTSMEGEAFENIKDINIEVDNLAIADLLNAYEAR